MKIILSRKGFDKGSGGCPSPYIVEEGKLFSLPIPNSRNYFSYKDMKFSDELSCYDLMEQLGISTRNGNAHTDPDIRRDLFYTPEENWRPMFGQQGMPQKHLHKQGVGEGSLFLFFGLFQDTRKLNGKYSFVPGTLKQIIWGYMQVGEPPVLVERNPDGFLHPHYYSCENYTAKDVNTVYSAADRLSFAPGLPGYGVFNYEKSLVLSKTAGENSKIYNEWELPAHFYRHRMSWHSGEGRWRLVDGKCIVTAAQRGQEFVIQDDPEAEAWAKDLIMKNVF